MSRRDEIVITYNGTDHSYVPTNEEINTCLLDKRRVFKQIGASLDEAVELKIDFNPVLQSVTDGSFTAHQFHGFGNIIEELIPRFENYESFLSFLDSVKSNPYDTAPTLRNYITRLYYHNDMPVLNKGDLIGSCNRSCTVLSEPDTAKYIDKLIEIGFLALTSEKPTKVFQVDCLDGSSLYLNADFYNPDRFAMGTPGVAHTDENKDSDS